MANNFSKYLVIFLTTLTLHTVGYAQNRHSDLIIIKDYYSDQTPKKDPEKIKRIKQMIANHKNDASFNYELGEFFLKIRKFIDAEVIFKKLYENHPSDKYEIAYGKSLLAQHKNNDVLQIIQLNGLTPQLKAQKYFLQASANFHLKRNDKGLKLINTAISLDKTAPTFFLLKARLLTAKGKTNLSMLVLDTIPEINIQATQKINLSEIDIARAENYINTKEYLKALGLYNAVIAKEPQNLNAYAGRGMTHLKLNNLENAFQDSLFLAQNDPGNAHAIYIIGNVLNNQKKYKEALDIYDNLVQNDNLQNLLSQAEINFNAKNYDKARILLNKYLRLDFQNPTALKLRGILKLKEGSSRDAASDLENSYELNPYDVNTLIALAQSYYNLGDYKKARKTYDKISAYFPKSKEITTIAYRLSCKINNSLSKKCANSTQAAINEQTFKAMQFMYLGFEDYAVDEIKKILKVYPNNLDVVKSYTGILKHTNQIDDAVYLLLKILKKYPNDTDTISELETIYVSGKSTIDIFNQMKNIFTENKDAVNIGYYLANFYYKNKNYTKALDITNEMLGRNNKYLKRSELYEVILKIMMHEPNKFAKEMNIYLDKYLVLKDKKHLTVRLLRQKIMQSQFEYPRFPALDAPAGENTARDYQVYAEYLKFIKSPKEAEIIYNKGTSRFPDNFKLFQSAFDFYTEPSDLQKLKDKFTNFNQNYQTFLQAKIHLKKDEKQKAIMILEKQFSQEYNGIIADLLLQINPTEKTIALVKSNITKIKNAKYPSHYRLAQALYNTYKFDEASHLLLPFFNQKKHNFDYKLLLTRSTFHINYKMSYDLFKQLLAESPNNTDFLIENIAYEVTNKNYTNAIYLFEKYKPKQKKYPHIYYYYGFALINNNQKEKGLEVLRSISSIKQDFFEKKYAQEWILKTN